LRLRGFAEDRRQDAAKNAHRLVPSAPEGNAMQEDKFQRWHLWVDLVPLYAFSSPFERKPSLIVMQSS
jgi:hypothetical protein